MKKWTKYAVYGGIVVGLIWGISIYIKAKNAPLKVKTATVERKDITTEITSSGKIQPKTSYSLNFTSSGKITYLPYEEGDSVQKGKVIARLQLSEAADQTFKAQADYRLTIEKIREFEYNNKDKPKDDKYNLTKYQLEASRDSAQAVYNQYLSAQGSKVIVSPIDGIITQINAKAGEVAPTSGPVVTVAKLSELEFLAEVDEQDAGRLQSEQNAEITLDAVPGTKLPGVIYDISQIAKINATGGTYYPTKISLIDDNQFIRTGMNGDATIKTAVEENVLVVPSETIIEEDTNKYIYTIENSKAKKIKVTIGLENDTESEIKSGLVEGVEVIIPELNTLTEGVKVEKTK